MIKVNSKYMRKILLILLLICGSIKGQVLTDELYLKYIDDSLTIGDPACKARLFFEKKGFRVNVDSKSLFIHSNDSLICLLNTNNNGIVINFSVFKKFNLTDTLTSIGSNFSESLLLKYDKIGVSGDLGNKIFIYDSNKEFENSIMLIYEPRDGVDVVMYEYDPEKLKDELRKSKLSSYFVSLGEM